MRNETKLVLPIGFEPTLAHTKNHADKSVIRVLHAALEYGMPNKPSNVAVGGVGSVLSSLAVAQQQQMDIDARVIMPYYPQLHVSLDAQDKIASVTHWYNGQSVTSDVYKIFSSQNVIQYLLVADQRYIYLFSALQHASSIYSNVGQESYFVDRVAYFSGAVAAFAMLGETTYLPHVLQAHSWGLCFIGKLIAEYRKIYNKHAQICSPYTVFTVHSSHNSDGSYNITDIPDIGIPRTATTISFTEEITSSYDHLIYVSDQLLKESITNNSSYSLLVLAKFLAGETSAILNNVFADQFDPSVCLPKHLAFELNKISDGKQKIKKLLNDSILIGINKYLPLDQPLTVYLGRYADEKGIEKLDTAITTTLANNGSFICMGVGYHPVIDRLRKKYAKYSHVIFFTTLVQQQAYGNYVRCAADIYVVPSKAEACGLVPMEANLSGALVVASSVGGLINVVIPDANGMLFDNNNSLEQMLTCAQQKWFELRDSGNLNIVLQLIQESAKKSFDWHAPNVGAAQAYRKLYQNLGNKMLSDPKAKAKAKPSLNTQNKSVVVLNMCLEYKQVKLGGVGEIVTSLCETINSRKYILKTEARVIMPYYPWHEVLIQQQILKNTQIIGTVKHLFNNQEISSSIMQVDNAGTVQYLVRPQQRELQDALFGKITCDQQALIYDVITPKITYFNSAVAAFVVSNQPYFPQIDVLNGHSWGCGLAARMIKSYYGTNYPKTVLTVHSEFSEQGLIPSQHEHMPYLHGIGLHFKAGKDISLLADGLSAVDHAIYVSNDLGVQAIRHTGMFNIRSVCRSIADAGKSTAIINNINNFFNPENLNLDLSSFVQAKYLAKQKINALLAVETTPYLQGKQLDLNKTLTVFVGRFLHEKGIDNLQTAIEVTLANNGCFVVMGLYGGGAEDDYIRDLDLAYRSNPHVIIMHEPAYVMQRKFGPWFRFAADFMFIPSHRESCGLVSMEAQLNASLVISSDVGGLKDTVKEAQTGFMYKNGKNGVINGRRNDAEITAAINRAHNFLTKLKENIQQYEQLLFNLYTYSKDNYVWEGRNGSLKKYTMLYDALVKNACKSQEYHQQVSSVDKKIEEFLLQHNFSFRPGALNNYNSSLHTPLTMAATLQDLVMCQLLVKNGADVNAPNGVGNIALHNAVDAGNSSIIEYLLAAGSDADFCNDNGFTPRDLGLQHNSVNARTGKIELLCGATSL